MAVYKVAYKSLSIRSMVPWEAVESSRERISLFNYRPQTYRSLLDEQDDKSEKEEAIDFECSWELGRGQLHRPGPKYHPPRATDIHTQQNCRFASLQGSSPPSYQWKCCGVSAWHLENAILRPRKPSSTGVPLPSVLRRHTLSPASKKRTKNMSDELTKIWANQRRRKKQICQLKGEAGMVEDNKGDVETLGLQLCSVENTVEGRRKRRADGDVEQGGGLSSTTTAAAVAGAWLTPQKKARSTLDVCDMKSTRGFGPLLINVEDLGRTLEANDLILVGDGAGFQVLNRP